MNLKSINLLIVLLSLIVSCKNDKKEEKVVNTGTIKKIDTLKNDNSVFEIKDSINTTEVIDSVKTDLQLDIKIDSLEDKNLFASYKIQDYKIEDFVFNTYSTYSSIKPEEKYLEIPYITKHNEGRFFDYDSYPEKLKVRIIPNALDTLEIITINSECYECLKILKIQDNNGKQLYYQITNNNDIIATQGNLDSLLIKRNLTTEKLYPKENEEYVTIEIDNWKNNTDLFEALKRRYTFSHNLNLKKKPNVSTIKAEIDKLNINFNSLDSLKYFYTKYTNTNDVISITDFLSYEGFYKYFHSGDIYIDSNKEVIALIESIDINYISKNNELFKVRWLENWYEENDDSGPLDDNYVEFKNGFYGINDWVNKRQISLFHPDMKEDDYFVIYELKLKYLDTYIHSHGNIVQYEKPNVN